MGINFYLVDAKCGIDGIIIRGSDEYLNREDTIGIKRSRTNEQVSRENRRKTSARTICWSRNTRTRSIGYRFVRSVILINDA